MGNVLYKTDELISYKGEKAVLLYSGGIDSMYAALQLVEAGLEVHALNVNLGQAVSNDLEENAKKIGITLSNVDAREELCKSFIRLGIMANALYNQHYPVSSSYTRPLIAQEGVKYAQKIDSRLIVHSSTPFQNSTSRFNMSIFALSPDIDIYCPAILDYCDRSEKVKVLKNYGIDLKEDRNFFSVDENLWARVVESGALEKHWLQVSKKDIFTWTNSEDTELEPLFITLRFQEGIPIELNHEPFSLLEMINKLNELLSRYEVGRFSGFEQNAFGVKHREVREAPAAYLLHTTHQLLEEMVLSDDELRIKKILDYEWVRLIVSGGWYSALKKPLDAAMLAFNLDIKGEVCWEVTKGSIFCRTKIADQSLSSAQCPQFLDEMTPFTLDSFYKQMARKFRI